ncbi:hypothetical protein M513_09906 [Trichuris suis]|uniref:Mos1 transposase HTH domain-containing protein n=1 Tax=Trichuris suis TaxID=68888 RepID=A0A085LW38_9BILA|nr:hypothetical protein M513_09906 [Trichuris suis]
MGLNMFNLISVIFGLVRRGSLIRRCASVVRANIKFLSKLGWQPRRIIQSLQQVYGSKSKSVVYEWIGRFKEGIEAIEDDRRAGRPATATSEGIVALVRNLVEKDRRISIRKIARMAGISLLSALGVLHETLGLRKLSARWVLKALREEQLVRRVNLSRELLTKIEANETGFFDRVVTGDETWIYQYDPESKIQSKQWLPTGSAGPVKFKAEQSARKVMATIFWYSDGVILTDFLEGERAVTASYYKAVLRKLKTGLARKRHGKLHLDVLFHHDNAPAYSSRTVRTVLREFRWKVIPHPPYSPDRALSDFFLFPKLKEHIKGTLFESMDVAKRAVSTWCNTQPPGFYKEGLWRWRHRQQKCLQVDGRYVEK